MPIKLKSRSSRSSTKLSPVIFRSSAIRSTRFQTAAALVEGLYESAVRVGTLRKHGDFGLGTFENIDGELVIINGHCFRARSDGSVQAVPR